ncbi:MAG: hypothetical protein KC502_00645 [Myxococcales bacterium]|nr:hypothetical protein [Myxococcales bacterium]
MTIVLAPQARPYPLAIAPLQRIDEGRLLQTSLHRAALRRMLTAKADEGRGGLQMPLLLTGEVVLRSGRRLVFGPAQKATAQWSDDVLEIDFAAIAPPAEELQGGRVELRLHAD